MIKLDNRIDRQVDALVGALTDPIIVFDPGWADVLPDWLKGEIKMQRLAQLVKAEEGTATDAEALAYVSNASLSQPIASDWVDIYMYLLTKVMGDKVPGEMRKENLDDYRMGELKAPQGMDLAPQGKGEGGERESGKAKGTGEGGSQSAQADGAGPLIKRGAGYLLDARPLFMPISYPSGDSKHPRKRRNVVEMHFKYIVDGEPLIREIAPYFMDL